MPRTRARRVLGLSADFLGPWMERNEPRKAMVLSAVCFSVACSSPRWASDAGTAPIRRRAPADPDEDRSAT